MYFTETKNIAKNDPILNIEKHREIQYIVISQKVYREISSHRKNFQNILINALLI